jgi:hypothetical protein
MATSAVVKNGLAPYKLQNLTVNTFICIVQLGLICKFAVACFGGHQPERPVTKYQYSFPGWFQLRHIMYKLNTIEVGCLIPSEDHMVVY